MSRPKPRRPASSRAATPRPRRLAGGRPGDDREATDEPAPQTTHEGTSADELGPWPVEEDEQGGAGSALRSPRVTRMLVVLVAVLALVLALQFAWLIRREYLRDDDAQARDVAQGEIAVPGDRPVVPNQLAVQEGVEAAADAAVKIVGRTFQDYDKEVDAATELMTPEFAEEYRLTTDDVREEFIAKKTTVEVRAVGQGVVRANDAELQALIFLNQYVIRGTGENAKTVYTPYRALLTMVNTDRGWLVDGIDTK